MSDTITISDEVMEAARHFLKADALNKTDWDSTLPEAMPQWERKKVVRQLTRHAYFRFIKAKSILQALCPDTDTRMYILAKAAQEQKP